VVATSCLRIASATISIDSADASIPANHQRMHVNSGATDTSLDYIDSNVLTYCINLLLQKLRWYVVDVLDAKSILCCEGGRSSHGIAPMRSNNFLVGF
jgi:hypothetical protein